ncbi:MAG TPA: ATP-binding protein [Gemmatimonadaceae bacterium]
MTIRAKLAVALAAILLLLALPLAISYSSLRQVHRATQSLRDREFAASLLLGRIRGSVDDLRRAETALLFVHDAGSRDAMSEAVGGIAAMADSLDRYDLDQAATEIRSAIREVEGLAPAEYQAALGGRGAEAEQISTSRVVPAISKVELAVGHAEVSLRQRTRVRVEQTAQAVGDAGTVSAIAAVAAILAALLIAAWLLQAIGRPVRELERGMHEISEGCFDYQLPIRSTRRDEFGRLAASFDRMAKQLAELDKLKAEFVSVASHELKTPINVIIGYLQLLEEGAYGPVSPKQNEILRTLESQAGALARLTKQLLDVSRFEAGGGTIAPRPIELRAFLLELEAAFRVLAQQRGVTLEVGWADDAPHEVHWDPDRMSEVLGNLLSNAVKFTSQGGRVSMRAERQGECVSLEVRDTGAGIPGDQLPHVFEKFYQADNQGSASQAGTGLGLAIAKEIVEAHGGTIECESTPGVGTTFTIVLPLRATPGRGQRRQSSVAEGAAS